MVSLYLCNFFIMSFYNLWYTVSPTVSDFNPVQDGPFRGCSRMGGNKKAPLHKICQTYPTMMKLGTDIPYLKKIQKIYESCDAPLAFCWHQCFFTENQQILFYQEIHISIAFSYIMSNSFNFFGVSKDCFNKHCYDFDDISRNDHSRSS